MKHLGHELADADGRRRHDRAQRLRLRGMRARRHAAHRSRSIACLDVAVAFGAAGALENRGRASNAGPRRNARIDGSLSPTRGTPPSI